MSRSITRRLLVSNLLILVAFLTLGAAILMGAYWAYKTLGWGGYWAWDPVENASFMPWLVGTAYLHSVLIQERRHMMKVWNVFLLALTFFLTIFGTFLTRSGLIASVHSFARSDIGQYFVWYMAFLILVIGALMIWRLPKLKADNEIESLVSREFAFLLNNWVLLGMMVFVLVATTFPLLSQWMRGEEVTVGPGFYNKWMVPLGIVLLFLAGLGPLVAFIPHAALAGILIKVGIDVIDWRFIKRLHRATRVDLVLMLVEGHLCRAVLEQIAVEARFDDEPGAGIAFQIDIEDAVGLTAQIRSIQEDISKEDL